MAQGGLQLILSCAPTPPAFAVTLSALSLTLCLVKFHSLFKVITTCPPFLFVGLGAKSRVLVHAKQVLLPLSYEFSLIDKYFVFFFFSFKTASVVEAGLKSMGSSDTPTFPNS